MTHKIHIHAFAIATLLFCATTPAYAQDSQTSNSEIISAPEAESNNEIIDEVIVTGQSNWSGHKGMTAFQAGDYATAEIEFERNFISLKRNQNALYNTAAEASVNINRSNNISQSFSATGQNSAGSAAGSATSTVNGNTAPTGSFSTSGKKGKNILNDGILSDQDFALTKYMSGLSELQLGKYKEAKKSLKTSLSYYSNNPDAHMRLGLIYLTENNIDKAAKHLERLEKMRIKCQKRECESYDRILQSASTLAEHITNTINQ